MNALFFVIITFFLIILQTIVLPTFHWSAQSFDLLIIIVLFLSLISPHYSMAAAIVLIGCIMDSISGTPFFFHIFSYLWIYIIVYIVKQLLFKKSIIFILIMSVASVLIQHGLLLFSIFVRQGYKAIVLLDFGLLAKQVFWGFVIIPPGIWLINVLWQNWIFATRLIKKIIVQKYRG